jgi:hypothetical protein
MRSREGMSMKMPNFDIKMPNFDKILTDISDYHVAISFLIFITGSVFQWFHKLDPGFTGFCGTILGFLFGHGWIQSKNGHDDSTTAGQP